MLIPQTWCHNRKTYILRCSVLASGWRNCHELMHGVQIGSWVRLKVSCACYCCRGHEAAVLCVQFDSEKIISGSCDKTIKVAYILRLSFLFFSLFISALTADMPCVATTLEFKARHMVNNHLDGCLMASFLGKPGQTGTRMVKPICILMMQEMIGWQWHQLNYMQIICTSLQTDNHASNSSLNLLQAGCSFWCPINSVKALEAS